MLVGGIAVVQIKCGGMRFSAPLTATVCLPLGDCRRLAPTQFLDVLVLRLAAPRTFTLGAFEVLQHRSLLALSDDVSRSPQVTREGLYGHTVLGSQGAKRLAAVMTTSRLLHWNG